MQKKMDIKEPNHKQNKGSWGGKWLKKNPQSTVMAPSQWRLFETIVLLKNNSCNFFQSLKLSEQLYWSNSRQSFIMKEVEKPVFLKCCYCWILLSQFTISPNPVGKTGTTEMLLTVIPKVFHKLLLYSTCIITAAPGAKFFNFKRFSFITTK